MVQAGVQFVGVAFPAGRVGDRRVVAPCRVGVDAFFFFPQEAVGLDAGLGYAHAIGPLHEHGVVGPEEGRAHAGIPEGAREFVVAAAHAHAAPGLPAADALTGSGYDAQVGAAEAVDRARVGVAAGVFDERVEELGRVAAGVMVVYDARDHRIVGQILIVQLGVVGFGRRHGREECGVAVVGGLYDRAQVGVVPGVGTGRRCRRSGVIGVVDRAIALGVPVGLARAGGQFLGFQVVGELLGQYRQRRVGVQSVLDIVDQIL